MPRSPCRPRMRPRSHASWRGRWTTSRSARSSVPAGWRGRRPSPGRAPPRRPSRRIGRQRGRRGAPEMRVAMDARKLHDGGIGTYIRGLVGALAVAGPRDEWTVLVDPAHRGGMRWPKGVREREVHAGKYGLAEHFVVPSAARNAGAELLHAPHYTLPLGWSGPSVVSIHDLIHVVAGPRDEWTVLVDPAHRGGMRWPKGVREREVHAGKYGLAEHFVVPSAARNAGAELG